MSTLESWKTNYRIVDRTLVIPFSSPRCVISSAVLGGGIIHADGVINHQIQLDVNRCAMTSPTADSTIGDPKKYLMRVSRQSGIEGPCVGLMTAVDMRCLVLKREIFNNIWVEGFFTVGVRNAVRVGEPTDSPASAKPVGKVGTINIILVTNVRLSRAAMVCAVGVATEGKTVSLLDGNILNATQSHSATGTGTDVVAIVSGEGPYSQYSGTHTKIGELIGKVVTEGVKEGMMKDRLWRQNT